MTEAGADLGRAPDALARILDRAPPVVDEDFRGHTRLTSRWGHGALHDHLGAMEGHVIITYYDAPQDIVGAAGPSAWPGRRGRGRSRSSRRARKGAGTLRVRSASAMCSCRTRGWRRAPSN